jgi:dTDP-glucose pyrophosphorylase
VVDQHDHVLIGLPDTVWFPSDALARLPEGRLSFLLFPVARPQFFDAVLTDDEGRVREIHVKSPTPGSNWIWGAAKMPGAVFHDLFRLWLRRGDEYLGTLINAWLADGGEAWGVQSGQSYLDVGAMDGYLEAVRMLAVAREGA